MSHTLRLHDFLPISHANGPGNRTVVWLQGCSLGCPGCFNQDTHSVDGGDVVAVDDLFTRITSLSDSIEGVTISGGEPLQQFIPIVALLHRIKKETSLSVLVFSGFTWNEIQKMEIAHRNRHAENLLNSPLPYIDILIAGRYDPTKRVAHDLYGSANQTVHFLTDRYTLADLACLPETEVVISLDGDVIVSGIDPIEF
ncbi:MAG: hypothetical protein B6242_01245 [Anaerolineaceae bacterium 4572_78]|nr:MAG: hypothetical protein B6242_01245 [Anaerolineaceae bacterium 4572_78]